MINKYTPKWLLNRDAKIELSKRVQKQNQCWIWQKFKDQSGYGQVDWEGKAWGAHRWAYHIYKGNIPKGKMVLHSCDNPSCCNPDHLWVGTQKDNIQDAISKGRFGVYTKERRLKKSRSSLAMWQKPGFKARRSKAVKKWWKDRRPSL